MIYQVTYYNETGDALLQATLNAANLRALLADLLTVETLRPPEGTVDIDVRRLPPSEE